MPRCGVGRYARPQKRGAWKPLAPGRGLAWRPPSKLAASTQGPFPDASHPTPRDTNPRSPFPVPHSPFVQSRCRRAVLCPREAGLSCPLEAAAMHGIADAGGGADRACTGMRRRRAVGRQRRPAATKAFVVRAKRKKPRKRPANHVGLCIPRMGREFTSGTAASRAHSFALPGY